MIAREVCAGLLFGYCVIKEGCKICVLIWTQVNVIYLDGSIYIEVDVYAMQKKNSGI